MTQSHEIAAIIYNALTEAPDFKTAPANIVSALAFAGYEIGPLSVNQTGRKACAHCGGGPEVKLGDDEYWRVHCRNCGVSTWSFQREDGAWASWDRRTP